MKKSRWTAMVEFSNGLQLLTRCQRGDAHHWQKDGDGGRIGGDAGERHGLLDAV